jgi:F420-dependent oxidoreductase-like protein
MDHLFQIPGIGEMDEPMFEAYTLLGALAARTRRARLGAMVTGVTYRNPALLAKQVTALDVLSGGRAILGIGAAWFEAEHNGLGFDFPPLSERFDRLEEALIICRAMFTEDAPSFDGRFYRIQGAMNRPRPVQAGGPPILIGGGGERRTLRLVAQYADACNLFGDAATVRHKLDVLDRHCADIGRDPATITKTRLGTLVIAASAAEADKKADELRRARGMEEAMFRAMVTAGDPDAVVEQVAVLLDTGLDGLVFNMPDAQDLETVTLAGRTLSDAFGSPGAGA